MIDTQIIDRIKGIEKFFEYVSPDYSFHNAKLESFVMAKISRL